MQIVHFIILFDFITTRENYMTDTTIIDPLGDVLELIDAHSSVYFQKDFYAPWGLHLENTGFAQFHVIVSGEASVKHFDKTYDLITGDVIMFPMGGAHMISHRETGNKPDQTATPPTKSDQKRTRIICGHFEYDLTTRHPIISELPSMLLLRSVEMPNTGHFQNLLRMLIEESGGSLLGSKGVTRHLSNALLVMILRTYFTQNERSHGFCRALRDPRIARALHMIHTKPADELRLTSIAEAAGMSRSAFANTFRETVGHTPGEYIIKWNMLCAAKKLKQGNMTIEDIAYEAGYQSSSTFSRAFHKFYGCTPRNYRAHR